MGNATSCLFFNAFFGFNQSYLFSPFGAAYHRARIFKKPVEVPDSLRQQVDHSTYTRNCAGHVREPFSIQSKMTMITSPLAG